MDITKSRSLSLSLSRADQTLLTIRQLSSIIHNTKMAEPYFQKISYSERLPKYKDFTPFEWEFKNSFSYDDYYGFSDLRIFKIQNSHRLHYMWDDFGIPRDSASFCNAFSANRERHRLVQRHLCSNLCFWDPRECFLDDTHSGNLQDLMCKDFHQKFNPSFSEQFQREFTDKIDWAPSGGLGHFPSEGLNKLIDDLGITTKLEYNEDNFAVNFDNLNRGFWNSIPERPLYVIEEKKCHDVIEALINVNREKIEINRNNMKTQFDQSYRGNGPLRNPILSLMMWGPLTDFNITKTDDQCKFDSFEDRQAGKHVCTNFSEKNYWMYTHNENIECVKGSIEILEGPVITPDLTFVYPCNRSGCNHKCVCDLCINNHMCKKSEHKEHIQDVNYECDVSQHVQCQEHEIDHPENFDENEDINVEKNIYFHNLELEKQPRKNSTGVLKFAGIKKTCSVCCKNVKDHLRNHHVIHLNCKLCNHQMKSALDETFWDKVCNICGKEFPDIKSLKHWHKRTHSSDWKCDDCDIDFNRKWTFKRHLIEIHGMEKKDFTYESEDMEDSTDSSENNFEAKNDTSSSNTDIESNTDEESKFECEYCHKTFAVKRYLDTHLRVTHTHRQTFKCDDCNQTFTLKETLKRHKETVHIKRKSNTCEFCGSNFTRIDNLNEHIQRAHMEEMEKFTCSYCGKKFGRKFSMSRHEETCTSNPKR